MKPEGRTVRLLYASQSSFGGIKIDKPNLTLIVRSTLLNMITDCFSATDYDYK